MLPPLLLPTDRATGYAIGDKTPPIVADFARGLYLLNGRAKLFSELFTYASASDRTYTDASGNFVSVPANTPRLDHHIWDGSRYVRDGLLLDAEGSANIMPYSAASVETWDEIQITAENLNLNALGSFNGVRAASKGAIWNRAADNVIGTVNAGEVLAITVWYREGSSGECRITIRDSLAGVDSYLNGPVGNLTPVGNGAGTITVLSQRAYPDGTYEIQVSITLLNTSTNFNVGIGPNTATVGDDIIVLGAQVERSEIPSQYIPTNGSPVSRAVDVLSIPSLAHNAAGFSPTPAAFGVNLEGTMSYPDDGDSITVRMLDWREDASNAAQFRVATDGTRTGRPRTVLAASGSFIIANGADDHYTPGVRVPYNVASRFGTSPETIRAAVEGTLTASATASTMPDLADYPMSLYPRGFEFTCRRLSMFPVTLTDAELLAATT